MNNSKRIPMISYYLFNKWNIQKFFITVVWNKFCVDWRAIVTVYTQGTIHNYCVHSIGNFEFFVLRVNILTIVAIELQLIHEIKLIKIFPKTEHHHWKGQKNRDCLNIIRNDVKPKKIFSMAKKNVRQFTLQQSVCLPPMWSLWNDFNSKL